MNIVNFNLENFTCDLFFCTDNVHGVRDKYQVWLSSALTFLVEQSAHPAMMYSNVQQCTAMCSNIQQ